MDLSLADLIAKNKEDKKKHPKKGGGKVKRRERSGKALRFAPYKQSGSTERQKGSGGERVVRTAGTWQNPTQTRGSSHKVIMKGEEEKI